MATIQSITTTVKAKAAAVKPWQWLATGVVAVIGLLAVAQHQTPDVRRYNPRQRW